MPTRWIRGTQQVVAAAALLAVTLLPYPAQAALGGPETAVSSDAQALNASIKTTARSHYRVHEIQMASGTLLREFADSAGTVFAVAWSGPTIPNLRLALGQYFDAYVSATQGKRLGRTRLEIRQNDWVMESGGHMRAFRGRAYLTQSLPAGTSLDEIH